MEKCFLTLVRLRLLLLEQDIAYRFSISQSTISRKFTSGINFMHIQFQQIPLWPPREFVHSHIPALFKEKYPSTQVIIDATEVFIQQPSLPELQRRTFSSYKNHNTFKALIGISPSGAVSLLMASFKHHYFHQVQLQLYVSSDLYSFCDFCVCTPVDVAVERIYLSKEWETKCVPELEDYFDMHMLPEIVNPTIYKPSYIL